MTTAATRPDLLTHEWHRFAAGGLDDAELFFAESTDPAHDQAAKSICATCPATDECRDYALREDVPHGIWGGASPIQPRGATAAPPQRRLHRVLGGVTVHTAQVLHAQRA